MLKHRARNLRDTHTIKVFIAYKRRDRLPRPQFRDRCQSSVTAAIRRLPRDSGISRIASPASSVWTPR